MIERLTTVEFWRNRPCWQQLPDTERGAMFNEINQLFINCFGEEMMTNAPQSVLVSGREYLVVWGIPEQQENFFLAVIGQLGWAHYFERLAYTVPGRETATDYVRRLESSRAIL